MEDIKISYEQIEKANQQINKMKVGSSDYSTVNERTIAFRKVYPSGQIETVMEDLTDSSVRYKAIIKDYNGTIISTATASERLTGDERKDRVNVTSMIENCETSAVGRALGFAGFGIDKSIATGEDMEKSQKNNKVYEIFTGMFIKEESALEIVKNAINELLRKMGVVKTSLNAIVEEKLWCSVGELNLSQYLKLEMKLKTLNMEDNEWHDLYNENIKIKDVVPKNQECVYNSSNLRFGLLALQKAGTDETLRDKVLDEYLNMGIDLTKYKNGNE